MSLPPLTVLELAGGVVLEVTIRDPTPIQLTNVSCQCGHRFLLTWQLTLSYEGGEPPHYNIVHLGSNHITSLTSKVWFTSDHRDDYITLDSVAMIRDNRYELNSSNLLESSSGYSSSRSLLIWLELNSNLLNGSLLKVTSQKVRVEALTQCSNGKCVPIVLDVVMVIISTRSFCNGN